MAHPVDDVLNIDPGVAAGGAERMAQIMWTDRAAAVLGHLPPEAISSTCSLVFPYHRFEQPFILVSR